MVNRMPWKREWVHEFLDVWKQAEADVLQEMDTAGLRDAPRGWSTFRLRCPMCMRLTKDGVIAKCDAGFQLLVQERVPGAPGFSYYELEMNRWDHRRAKEWLVARLEDAIERVKSS